MTHHSPLRLLLCTAFAAVGVVACGGGGGDTPAPAPATVTPPVIVPLLNNPDPASGCAAVAALAASQSTTGMQVAITSATLQTTATPDAA